MSGYRGPQVKIDPLKKEVKNTELRHATSSHVIPYTLPEAGDCCCPVPFCWTSATFAPRLTLGVFPQIRDTNFELGIWTYSQVSIV